MLLLLLLSEMGGLLHSILAWYGSAVNSFGSEF